MYFNHSSINYNELFQAQFLLPGSSKGHYDELSLILGECLGRTDILVAWAFPCVWLSSLQAQFLLPGSDKGHYDELSLILGLES